MTLRSLPILLTLTLAAPSFAADNKAILDDFDEFMAAAMKEFKVPGAAVAVVKDGKILLAKGYGYRDVAHQKPVTGSTIFPIASITKSFTVTALGTLVDQGRLDWDKPVREVWPEFRMNEPVATDQITVRDMVTHRTGLPRHDLTWYTSTFTREDLVSRLRYLELNKPIRSTFQYNNLMFLTAGFLGGKIDGTTWEQHVQRRVLDPLGMTHTLFHSEDARKTSDCALPYRKNRKTDEVAEIPFARWGDVGPAGAINSSIDDMAKYLQMHLGKGVAGGKQILGRNNSEQMQTPQMVIQGTPPFPELGETSYGMGLFIETYRGHKHVEHGGNLDGFSLQLSFLPNEGIGVVVLTNLNGTPLRDLVPYAVYDRLLGLDKVDWVKRFSEIEKKSREQERTAESRGFTGQKPGTHPSHAVDEYTGEFRHPGYGTIAIRNEGEKLFMRLNDLERRIEHFHYDTFQVPADPLDSLEKLKITFPVAADGEISSIHATLESSVKDIVFTRVPERRMYETSFLKQFSGDYDFPGQAVTISLSGETELQMTSPGAPARKLIPKRGTRFDLQGLTGVSIEFKPGEAVVYTPGTAFVVPKKK